MDFKFFDTNIWKNSFLCEGYVFRIDVVLKCNGPLRTDGGTTTLVPISIDHNCKGDENKVERKQLQAQVKSKDISNLTLSKFLEMNFIQLWIS